MPLYITFHFINAYEEKDGDGRVTALIADCCEHNADTTILDKLRIQNLRSYTGKDVLPDARFLIRYFSMKCYVVEMSTIHIDILLVCLFLLTQKHRVGRFRIPLDGSAYGELDAALDPNEHGKGMDMCSINPAFLGKKYRYAYACGAERPCNFPNTLTKVISTALASYFNSIFP